MQKMNAISAQDFIDKMSTAHPPHVLDVREDIEFQTRNIGGKHIPLGRLPAMIGELVWDKTDDIVVICHAGLRSETARKILYNAGYTRVKNLTGGLNALNRIRQKP